MTTRVPATRVVTELTDDQLERCLATAKRAAKSDLYGCCKVKVSLDKALSHNAKEYVQIKVRDHPDKNKKVQLHQLVAWMDPDDDKRREMRAAISGGGIEISHLCKQKDCMNPQHLVAESCAKNKSRNNCTTVIRINGVIHPCCKHKPRCVYTAQDVRDILDYVV